MIVVRQTLGWIDFSCGKRKKWNYIRVSQFVKKTGLSIRSVSPAIRVLADMELIEVRNNKGIEMKSSDEQNELQICFMQSEEESLKVNLSFVDQCRMLQKLCTFF